MSEKANQEVDLRDYADEIGTVSVPLSVAKLIVQLCWHDGHVPLLIGESGTGKTAAIDQLSRHNDMEMIPFHLGNVDSTDVRGPMWPQEDGTFTFLKPGDIPVKWEPTFRQDRVLHQLKLQDHTLDDILEEDFDFNALEDFSDDDLDVVFSIRRDIEKETRNAALFFDEANRGSKDAMNAVMSVWQEGRLGDATLGPNVRICGAMNPPAGAYAVNSQFSNDPAMRRRVCQVVVMFSHSEFMRYMEDPNKQIEIERIPPLDYKELQERDKYRPAHEAVISYLRADPDVAMDSKSREAGKVYGCPPTWEAVSDTLYTIERLELNLDDAVVKRVVTAKIGGHVGHSEAANFLEHFEKQTDTIEPLEVLYHYEPETPTWRKVQKLLNKSEYMGLMKVLEASVRYIFDPKDEDFELEEVVPQLGRIINDLPANCAQDLIIHCSTVAEDVHGGFTSDVRDLMQALLNDDNFKEYQKRSLDMAMEYQGQASPQEEETSDT